MITNNNQQGGSAEIELCTFPHGHQELGTRQIKVMYSAPANVRRVITLSINLAVCSPQVNPGINQRHFSSRLSAVSRGVKHQRSIEEN